MIDGHERGCGLKIMRGAGLGGARGGGWLVGSASLLDDRRLPSNKIKACATQTTHPSEGGHHRNTVRHKHRRVLLPLASRRGRRSRRQQRLLAGQAREAVAVVIEGQAGVLEVKHWAEGGDAACLVPRSRRGRIAGSSGGGCSSRGGLGVGRMRPEVQGGAVRLERGHGGGGAGEAHGQCVAGGGWGGFRGGGGCGGCGGVSGPDSGQDAGCDRADALLVSVCGFCCVGCERPGASAADEHNTRTESPCLSQVAAPVTQILGLLVARLSHKRLDITSYPLILASPTITSPVGPAFHASLPRTPGAGSTQHRSRCRYRAASPWPPPLPARLSGSL